MIKFKETANNLRPLATFILDDGWAKDLTRIKPLFDQKGIVGCSAIISNNIGQTNYMTLEQIRILKDSGWEIMSHSKTHPVLTEISELDLNEELGGSFRDLNSLGLEVENMVIPFSQHNARVREVSKKHYKSTFTAMGGRISPPINSHNLKRTLIGEDQNSPFEYYETIIDNTYDNKEWLVFCLHSNQFEGTDQV